ncbi:CPBP family intramembrane metalloprotease [Weissella confusa]|uniref:CPBP family intramembrane metalloprotease n=1 Tax=Weissella fermenti TaxID=2987699 RepID=A0ABT6D4K4_9LACO|nr:MULTISPECIES: CPBP family intramembrane glutamic endopeptidase [Weissella]MBJ7688675.1 CPBP family intramembrane metalloprotease [Weissella confusa]MCW0925991.1 CPBP family intramembrane metalloprotease [Weissella sp. LMG 11983]MDF9300459.1 CPBP family intramembrane metalloprotease [Weissella sp. BK2]
MPKVRHTMLALVVVEAALVGLTLLLNKVLTQVQVPFDRHMTVPKSAYLLFPGFLFLIMTLGTLVSADYTFKGFIIAAVLTLLVVFFEEYLWRGIILSVVKQYIKSELVLVIVLGMLFGLWHITNAISQPWHDTVAQMIEIAGFGMLQTALMLRTKNLLYPMIMHGLLDFSGILRNLAEPHGIPYHIAAVVLASYAVPALWYVYLGRRKRGEMSDE